MQTKLYIDGELTDGLAGRAIDVINPVDGTLLAAIAGAGAENVDRAVAAAQRAFPRCATTRKSVWINVDATLPDWYAR
jgi:aldehyde dehydrogenase (NAD+)